MKPDKSHAFKQFLFFLTFPENKKRVYREARQGLSITERNLLIQMTRQKDNEWKQAA